MPVDIVGLGSRVTGLFLCRQEIRAGIDDPYQGCAKSCLRSWVFNSIGAYPGYLDLITATGFHEGVTVGGSRYYAGNGDGD